MRRLAGFLIIAGLALVLVLIATHRTQTHPGTSTITPAARSSTNGHNQTYSVVGNHIVNSSGQVVLVHGVNRSSLENSCTGATVTGQETGIPASDFAKMHKAWNATVVRLPLDQEFWLSNCRNYRATVERAVREIEANHMVVILDLHWWTVPPKLTFATVAQAVCMPNQNSLLFWRQVASKYRSHPNVWFELYNEPDPRAATTAAQWHSWLDGGTVSCENNVTRKPIGNFASVGMQQLVNSIRATGASNIILADSIARAYTLEGIPLLSGTNIAYAIHPYLIPLTDGGSRWSVSSWDTRFGDLAERVPVVATEFGDLECGDTTYAHAYDEAILSYFRTHQISYIAWDWFAAYGCDVPELITDAAGTCRPSMGCTIQNALMSYPRAATSFASSRTAIAAPMQHGP